MQAVLIKIARNPDCPTAPEAFPGWVVPDTEDLFAVDMRAEADIEAIPPIPAAWAITHLPTGMRVNYGEYTRAGRQADAFCIAMRFYEEIKKLGANIYSKRPEDITNPVKALDADGVRAFWTRVAGWEEKPSPLSERGDA